MLAKLSNSSSVRSISVFLNSFFIPSGLILEARIHPDAVSLNFDTAPNSRSIESLSYPGQSFYQLKTTIPMIDKIITTVSPSCFAKSVALPTASSKLNTQL